MTSPPVQRLREIATKTASVLVALGLVACADASGGSAQDDTTIVTGTLLPPLTTVPPTTTAPVCTVTVEPGDALIAISNRTGVPIPDIEAENSLLASDTIHPGEVFDICVGNDVDDVTGASRLPPPADAVNVQQLELNELFAGTSLIPLTIDGDSGNYTRQAACAARLGLGMRAHTGHIVPGSEEERAIFAATELSIPAGAPTDAAKWILIDKTCQVIFIGEGDDRLLDVFPTSTGEAGFETHNTRAKAFRFDPALDNDGWHDSSQFPVEVDNPANGNMYKPLYFNDGQAIHGAGFIPPLPRSKGCARTFPNHQDMIIEWLGLDTLTEATWNPGDINVMVAVQGRFRELIKSDNS